MVNMIRDVNTDISVKIPNRKNFVTPILFLCQKVKKNYLYLNVYFIPYLEFCYNVSKVANKGF